MAHEILGDSPEKIFGSTDRPKLTPLRIIDGVIVDEPSIREEDDEDSPV